MNVYKKYIKIIIFIIIILFLSFFCWKVIKKNRNGNNTNSQEIVDNILNIKTYKSKITAQVNSNKNKNIYIIKQDYTAENISIQEVLEPANIAGMRIIKDNEKITLENTDLNLSNVFENYKGLEENSLDLICFIEDYKKNEESSFEENTAEIIMKTKNKKNKYYQNKILYINKETKKPTKLIIEDNSKNIVINIQYNEIEF